MTDDRLVLVETDAAGYAVLTLNRPAAMNALSSALCKAFTQAVSTLEADPAVRVLIVTGAGRAFCAGLDLKELGGGGSVSAFIENDDPVRALELFTGPIIGAINGVAVTGGFELALACDILIASTEARFADTHARVGIIPGWGLSQKLSRMVGIARAKEISLAGNFVSAGRALDIGLINRVVAPEQVLLQARQLALDMLSAVPEMLPAYKQLIDEGFGLPFADAKRLERQRSAAWSQAVSAEDIEQRRIGVQQRGRMQKPT
jgi:enoyl-CoA hydratase